MGEHQDVSGSQGTKDDLFAAPSIQLPKGGGAIRGIGEKFAANPVTGTGSISVPIATSPGRSGFGPSLSLSYDSGSGNGTFGLGWSLSLPSITRRTDKGLPLYQDADNSDIFVLSGAEDLVPVLAEDNQGNWSAENPVQRDGYTIMQYRPRVEGLFFRIERWCRQSDGDTYWRSISKDNVTTFYGKTAESRIADSDDLTHIFSWLICQSQDDKGNAIVYSYAAEDSANVDISQTNERNRSLPDHRSANRYLAGIRYGNTTSLLIQPDITRLSWLFEVVFDYGQGYVQANPPDAQGRTFVSATLSPAGTWPVRQDPFSHYRACFEVRNYRLCRRVLMFHHFQTELGTPDYLVRSTDFTYQENPIATVMTSVTQSGYVWQAGAYLQASLPPLEFEYSQAQVQNIVNDVDPDSLANLPGDVDGSRYRWIDLDGEGVQCILAEQDGAWFYKRNLTPLSLAIAGGQADPVVSFEAQTQIRRLPAFAQPRTPRHQFMSLASNGHLDCLVLERPGAGFYERTENEDWTPFTPLESVPNVDWNDPNLRFIDVDGDGFSDVLVTDQDSLTYYPSLAQTGFAGPIRLPKATDEEVGPAVVFADRSKAIFLADMSGDGLSDIVRIRNGEICYWPNLGYGKFGAKVNMDNAPWFDLPDQFDPARIRLGDVDGSGVTDIIYLADDGVRIYFNQSGNAWAAPATVLDFPPVSNLASIQALDLLGNGTVCLVWTSSSPGDVGQSMRYVNLMGGGKPYLLVRSWNNLGAEARVSYAPSTAFYLADRAAGTPWATRLPFPVQVVERVETYDWISRNRFVSRYAYHHGYYDGIEREFRGFGMVEQRDTEELGVLTQDGLFPASINIDAASYVPPVLTKTWFHLGTYPSGPYVSKVFASEYWIEPNLTTEQAAAMQLADTMLPDDLTGDEIREALRSLKGSMLRQETYALDGTTAAALPYTVSEKNFTVTRLQPFGPNRHAVFFTHSRESIDLHYERTLYSVEAISVADPRVTHAMTLAVDAYGNELQSAAIAYGRRYTDPDPLLTQDDHVNQSAIHVTYTQKGYTNAILLDDAYRPPLSAEACTYELINVSPNHGSAVQGVTSLFALDDMVAAIALAADGQHDLPYEDINATGATTSHPYRRIIEHVRTLYRGDQLTGGLPLGTLESLALPFVSYKLALTPGLLAHYQRGAENLLPTPASVLGAAGGYVLSDDQKTAGLFPATDPAGNWWISSGRLFYSTGTADPPATELAQAQAHFFSSRRFVDPFGNATTVTPDGHDLLTVQVDDPVGNIVFAANDYRLLQPVLMTDPNGNQSAVAFDALGLVAGSAVMDKAVTTPQDSLTGFVADLTQSQIDAFIADPSGPQAAALLGNATSRIVYDLTRFAQPPSTLQSPLPGFAATVTRETHVQYLPAGKTSRLQTGIAYSDGFGRVIQQKLFADPGPLVAGGPAVPTRWLASGWTIFNNKGKPVRKYEPFFSATPDFSFGATVGVTSTLFYDPVGRIVATLHPNQTWEKVVFDPWRQESWDANDTVVIHDPVMDADSVDPAMDADVGVYFQRIPRGDYFPTWYTQRSNNALGPDEEDAANKAFAHAGTYTTVYFDTLGRTFLTLAFNRYPSNGTTVESHDRTSILFDIEGNQRSITDALDRQIMTYDYDMLGTKIGSNSADAGQRWMLNDAVGKPLMGWDSRKHRLRHEYDAAHRPTTLYVQTGSGIEAQAERAVYGETLPNAATLNLRGKIYQQYDGAGLVTHIQYDFKGNLLSSSRQLILKQNFSQVVDWSQANALDTTFTSSTKYDALNRPVSSTAPDGSVLSPTYNQTGLLTQVNGVLTTPGSAPTPTGFVTNITYDAKGQRQQISYGNGAVTTYAYDPLTFRLTSLYTARSAVRFPGDDPTPPNPPRGVQNLSYTYDPIGNITQIRDAAQQTIYFNNAQVAPVMAYSYDALYRVISAKGREAIGQVSQPQTTYDDAPRMNQPLPNDWQAMRSYTETYQYDKVGNFLALIHVANNGNWNRTYAYDEPNVPPQNNRLTSTTVGTSAATIKEPYTYDAHGNMMSMPHLVSMASDFKDQLQATQQQVVNAGPGPQTFCVYDAGGQRARKVNVNASGTVINERIYLGGFEVYREYDNTGAATLERQMLHVMDGKQRIALVENLTKGQDGSPKQLIRYQFSNHLGSACLELGSGGNIISYEEYYPYGSTSYQAVDKGTAAASKRYRYAAKELDEESGLYSYGVRFYAPWISRWISIDPLGLTDGSNGYVFVRNRPTRFIDPDGRQSVDTATQSSPSPQGRIAEAMTAPLRIGNASQPISASGVGGNKPSSPLPSQLNGGNAGDPTNPFSLKIPDVPRSLFYDSPLTFAQRILTGGDRMLREKEGDAPPTEINFGEITTPDSLRPRYDIKIDISRLHLYLRTSELKVPVPSLKLGTFKIDSDGIHLGRFFLTQTDDVNLDRVALTDPMRETSSWQQSLNANRDNKSLPGSFLETPYLRLVYGTLGVPTEPVTDTAKGPGWGLLPQFTRDPSITLGFNFTKDLAVSATYSPAAVNNVVGLAPSGAYTKGNAPGGDWLFGGASPLNVPALFIQPQAPLNSYFGLTVRGKLPF